MSHPFVSERLANVRQDAQLLVDTPAIKNAGSRLSSSRANRMSGRPRRPSHRPRTA